MGRSRFQWPCGSDNIEHRLALVERCQPAKFSLCHQSERPIRAGRGLRKRLGFYSSQHVSPAPFDDARVRERFSCSHGSSAACGCMGRKLKLLSDCAGISQQLGRSNLFQPQLRGPARGSAQCWRGRHLSSRADLPRAGLRSAALCAPRWRLLRPVSPSPVFWGRLA